MFGLEIAEQRLDGFQQPVNVLPSFWCDSISVFPLANRLTAYTQQSSKLRGRDAEGGADSVQLEKIRTSAALIEMAIYAGHDDVGDRVRLKLDGASRRTWCEGRDRDDRWKLPDVPTFEKPISQLGSNTGSYVLSVSRSEERRV